MNPRILRFESLALRAVCGCWALSVAWAQPVLLTHPRPAETLAGGKVAFAVVAQGAPPVSYRWEKDGQPVTGADDDILVLDGVQAPDAGVYRVVVTDAGGSVTSDGAALGLRIPRPGDVDLSFTRDAGLADRVHALATQAGGKLIVVGDFRSVDGVKHGRVARLHPDGRADHTFGTGLAGADGFVDCVAVQADGKVLIGGSFGGVDGVTRRHLARLNVDGSLDRSFLADLDGPDGSVMAVAPTVDGKVLIGGAFRNVQGTASLGVARLLPDGRLDSGFSSPVKPPSLPGAPDPRIDAITLLAGGRLLLAGSFNTDVSGPPASLARLHEDGSVDPSFPGNLGETLGLPLWVGQQADGKALIGLTKSNASGDRHDQVVQLDDQGDPGAVLLDWVNGPWTEVKLAAALPDGKVLVWGTVAETSGVVPYRLAVLNADGSEVAGTPFGVGIPGPSIAELAAQPDGRLYVTGYAEKVGGFPMDGLARVQADGTLDAGFQLPGTGVPRLVWTMARQPDGKLLIGGSFLSVEGVPRGHLARLNADGKLDRTFMAGLAGAEELVSSIVLQPDGKILLAGWFTNVNGIACRGLFRLHADGTSDTSFQVRSDGDAAWVRSVAVQSDGKIVYGEYVFGEVDGAYRLVRVHADGTPDSGWPAGLGGTDHLATTLLVEPDGKVLVGGVFSMDQPGARRGLVRLDLDGNIDPGFAPLWVNEMGNVWTVVRQADGKLLVGGAFTNLNGVARGGLARLESDGSLDPTFLTDLPGANDMVYAMALQPDGKAVIGGWFTEVNGVQQSSLARLHPDGRLDTSFRPELNGDITWVYEVLVLPDGKILVSGLFSAMNGEPASHLARLAGDAAPLPNMVAYDLAGVPGAIRLVIDGGGWDQLRVWGSADLRQWEVLGPATLLRPGTFEFTESRPADGSPRFYRVSAP